MNDVDTQQSAAELAAVLAYTAIKSNDRVGLIIFSDRIELYIPPKKGRAHVWRVIREILTFKPTRRATDLEGALEFLGKRLADNLLGEFRDVLRHRDADRMFRTGLRNQGDGYAGLLQGVPEVHALNELHHDVP